MADLLDFEKAKLFLMHESDGTSLYQHLCDVVMKILLENPQNALEQLEFLSSIEKQGKFKKKEELEALRSSTSNAKEKEEVISDVMQDMSALQWAGVGLSETDAFRMQLSLYKLEQKVNASHLRFWGKILGTESDYYVAEAEVALDEDEEVDPSAEIGGSNKYTFFVCNQIGESWVKLPAVLPAQILAARKIKRYLTGNLESPVYGHPPFHWKEREYLRAAIARISASTVVIPDGVYRVAEGDNQFALELIPEEDATKPEMESLQSLGGWVHLHYELNVQGRCTPKKVVNEDGEEVDDPEGPEIVVPLTNLEPEEESWTVRTYPHVGTGITPSVVCLKSDRWLGAYSVFTGGRHTNFYLGYGIKSTKENYSPEHPLPIRKEYGNPEYKEQKDPNKDPNPPEAEEEEAEGDNENEPEEEEEEEEEATEEQ